VTSIGGSMQSGALATRTKHQKQTSKIHLNTTPVTFLKRKCAHVRRIDISFACNQKLVHCRMNMTGTEMPRGDTTTRIMSSQVKSGLLETGTEHHIKTLKIKTQQFEISKTTLKQRHAHRSFAFTSALCSISSSHIAVRP
jgi:hypothetical protein